MAVIKLGNESTRALRITRKENLSFQLFEPERGSFRLQGRAHHVLWSGQKRQMACNLVVVETIMTRTSRPEFEVLGKSKHPWSVLCLLADPPVSSWLQGLSIVFARAFARAFASKTPQYPEWQPTSLCFTSCESTMIVIGLHMFLYLLAMTSKGVSLC